MGGHKVPHLDTSRGDAVKSQLELIELHPIVTMPLVVVLSQFTPVAVCAPGVVDLHDPAVLVMLVDAQDDKLMPAHCAERVIGARSRARGHGPPVVPCQRQQIPELFLVLPGVLAIDENRVQGIDRSLRHCLQGVVPHPTADCQVGAKDLGEALLQDDRPHSMVLHVVIALLQIFRGRKEEIGWMRRVAGVSDHGYHLIHRNHGLPTIDHEDQLEDHFAVCLLGAVKCLALEQLGAGCCDGRNAGKVVAVAQLALRDIVKLRKAGASPETPPRQSRL
mmetsp:Transcript_71683/g.197861  ORF Transcript_71683/g.197861 Transcript_71683/m.197861 type:complete len:277 (-) Transcript_71683:112-942(-)